MNYILVETEFDRFNLGTIVKIFENKEDCYYEFCDRIGHWNVFFNHIPDAEHSIENDEDKVHCLHQWTSERSNHMVKLEMKINKIIVRSFTIDDDDVQEKFIEFLNTVEAKKWIEEEYFSLLRDNVITEFEKEEYLTSWRDGDNFGWMFDWDDGIIYGAYIYSIDGIKTKIALEFDQE